MRRLIFLLLPLITAIGLPALATEPDMLARIGAQIEQHALLRAEFTQSKRMSALKRPLITSGRIVFSHRHGVVWQIEQPYRMSYMLAEERIVEIAADGTRRERDTRDVPGLAQIGRIFRALLGANMAALREVFDVAVKGDPAKWEIELKPRQAQFTQYLSSVHLSGGRFIESISISETGGDTTQISFRNTQSANVPNEAELQFFGVTGKP